MATKRRTNPLLNLPGYRFEEYDAETGVLSIGMGDLIFETVDFLGRWTWGVRTSESATWSKSRKRFGVLAASSVIYWKQGNAERAMRKFIERLGKKRNHST